MSTADRVVARLGALGLVAVVAAAAWAWPQLPESVPIHFGVGGQPDAWGPKYILLSLPGIGVALYWLLTVVASHPDLYAQANAMAATPEGRIRQYVIVRQLLLALRTLVVLLFLGNLVMATLVATGRLQGLGAWLMPAELVALAALVASYITAALRVR